VGRHPRTSVRAPLNRPALVLLAWLALLPPQPAVAQGRDQSPSAQELWQAYPLHERPESGSRQAATPASAATPAPVTRPPEAGSWRATLELAVAAVLIAFAVGFALAARPPRRWSSPSSAGTRATTPASGSQAPQPIAAQPSATAKAGWTTEIEWCAADGEARFRAVARPAEGGAAVVVDESAWLPWPPSGAAAVQALTAAAEELETRLVAAGWRPLPRGDAWYAKRFAWEPVASTPAADRRFTRRAAWPQNTERLWRCEVELDTGSGDARFRAVVRRPSDRQRHIIGTSTVLRDLAAALLAAGWESAGTGANWYSERFVWRGERSPPEGLAAHSTPTGRAT
jgi:hypothetical protein